MKAFVEHLSGIIRVGPDCDEYGKPFVYAVGFSSVDGKTAVVKALVSGGGFSPEYAAPIRTALQSLGLVAQWERK